MSNQAYVSKKTIQDAHARLYFSVLRLFDTVDPPYPSPTPTPTPTPNKPPSQPQISPSISSSAHKTHYVASTPVNSRRTTTPKTLTKRTITPKTHTKRTIIPKTCTKKTTTPIQKTKVCPKIYPKPVRNAVPPPASPYTNEVNYHQLKMMEKLENFLQLSK